MTEPTQKTAIITEYLGDISTELLLQNLTNVNHFHNSIDAIRLAVPSGFTMIAEIERPIYGGEEMQRHVDEMNEYIKRTGKCPEEPGKLLRLILEPNKTSEGIL